MRVLVCGGRDFKRYDIVKKVLSTLDITEICSGGARGADEDGERYAAEFGIPLQQFRANWQQYNRAAGHIRNQQMLTEFQPDTVVVFPGGNGTASMLRLARRDSNVHNIFAVDDEGNICWEGKVVQPLLIEEWP